MTRLYEITAEYEALLDKDEYEAEDMEALSSLLDSFETKAIAVSHYICNLEAEMQAVKERRIAMYERQKNLDKKVESLKLYLSENLQKANVKLINSCPDFVIKLRTNPVSVRVEDESLVPTGYMKTKKVITVDKAKVKQDIEEGIAVPGASLERKLSVQIK